MGQPDELPAKRQLYVCFALTCLGCREDSEECLSVKTQEAVVQNFQALNSEGMRSWRERELGSRSARRTLTLEPGAMMEKERRGGMAVEWSGVRHVIRT